MLVLGLAIGLFGYLALVAGRCFFRVEEGHLAVLTRFGAALGDPAKPEGLRTFGPGLHSKWPWDKVSPVPVMEQSIDLSGEQRGRSAMAADGTVLRFDSILRFVPMESHLRHLLFGLRAPLDHVTSVFTCLLRNEIANFKSPGNTTASTRNADDGHRIGQPVSAEEDEGSYAVIRRERRELNLRIEAFCRDRIGADYGVKFVAVDLTDILPPDELADALNAVINARAEADALYARMEADCQQRVVAAERGVEVARRRAAASESEVLVLASFLEEMVKQGTLTDYVERRRNEVLSQSKSYFLRSA